MHKVHIEPLYLSHIMVVLVEERFPVFKLVAVLPVVQHSGEEVGVEAVGEAGVFEWRHEWTTVEQPLAEIVDNLL